MSATSRELTPARRAAASPVEKAFDGLRQRLWAQGQILAEPEAGQTILIAAPARGSGVSTVAAGLADSCARGTGQSTLAILDDGGREDGTPVTGDMGEDGIRRRGADFADQLDRHRLTFVGENSPGPRALLARFKMRYPHVFIDGGSIHDTAFLSLAGLVDRRFLVLDLRYLRRSELNNLKRELDRMPFKFDGFIGNRHVDALPQTLGRLTS